MIKKNYLLTICVILLIMAFFSYAQDNKVTMDTAKILENYKESCDGLKLLIQSPNAWEKACFDEDEKKANKLIANLDIIANLKIEGIENTLVEKINYSPFHETEHGFMQREQEFPVYATLCKMNLGAIDPLVKFIKLNSYKDKQVPVVLSVRCVVKIYDKGGFGKEMAKKRLELELEKATEPEKVNIKKALELIDSE
ncbi:MAG: hypothetical protein HZA48_10250 [Planctomycetes bacterium]|nr:hypothetical protein [Planctomycetota bacterium]